MTTDIQKDPKKSFAVRFLPWLLGAVMLLIYGFTLNHWVTLLNIGQVATISGQMWQPQLFGPLTFLATYPFRWLHPAQIPLALNLFSALCGSLTLVLLARSVALLPHDRTESERQRERSDFSFLTGWPAWLPPVLAVALGGLQLTFWQQATSFTGETFHLLLFAVIVWQLLEYRLDESEWRLFTVVFVYGAGITENWGLVGFFPILLTAIIWLRRLDFFQVRFLARLAAWALAGTAFFLLLPLVMKFSGKYPISLWDALLPNLRTDWQVLKSITDGGVRHNLALMSLSTLLPAFVMSIRWSPSFGDKSRIGTSLANNMVHFVHAVIFTVCVWVMFDPAFSPRQLAIFGSPSLTLYYLAALSIGYYCGYFLLVFGKKIVPTRRNSRPEPALPKNLLWLCPVIVAGTIIAAALAVGTLVYRNHVIVRNLNDDTLLKYARLTTQNLPPAGAILLCDSETPGQDVPLRAFLIQAMLAREGREKNFPIVDTQSLNWAPYHRYLHQHFPKVWPQIVSEKDMGAVNPLGLLGMLNLLSKTNALYYLNPSFGYYFEQFYQEPRGLAYPLKPLPDDTLLPPALEKNLMAANEIFWADTAATEFPKIEKALDLQKTLASSTPPHPKNFADWLLVHLHSLPEPNPNAIMAGTFYSRSLNFWGVQLQRAGELEKAAAQFTAAVKLNPDNVIAAINLDFNRTLRAGSTASIDLTRVTADQFGKYRSWNAVLNANGPFDETSFCFENGVYLLQGGLMRQAAAPFTRVRQLAPNNLATRLFLAQIYIFARQADRALEALHDPLTQPRKFSLTVSNSTEMNILASAAHFQKNEISRGVELLETEINRHPEDNTLLTAATQAYFMRGLYTNALHVIERKLAQTPDDPQWLFGKGYASIQIGANENAIKALTRVLEIQTNDPTARFNRALAYLNSDKLDAARTDYNQLQTSFTNSFQVAFGLAEIAWRQHDTNESIRNYQLYLANAPTNSVEAKTVRERLTQLRAK
jgi:tetratricopeptide (TPR) repeat protein